MLLEFAFCFWFFCWGFFSLKKQKANFGWRRWKMLNLHFLILNTAELHWLFTLMHHSPFHPLYSTYWFLLSVENCGVFVMNKWRSSDFKYFYVLVKCLPLQLWEVKLKLQGSSQKADSSIKPLDLIWIILWAWFMTSNAMDKTHLFLGVFCFFFNGGLACPCVTSED